MTINKLFPGRPNYVGPKSGPFALLHHSELWEWSHDVTERVDYVQREKPEHEQKIRLHNMIYLGGCAVFKSRTRTGWYKAWATWSEAHPDADAKILAYIKKHIPDCAWNGRELVFSRARKVGCHVRRMVRP